MNEFVYKSNDVHDVFVFTKKLEYIKDKILARDRDRFNSLNLIISSFNKQFY